MSDIHRPSGEQPMVVFHYNQPKHKYWITARYGDFYHSIVYCSTRSADELMRGFLAEIRHGKPCFVQDTNNGTCNIVNLGKADVICIEHFEE